MTKAISVESLCQQKGLKMTKQRKTVLKVIAKSRDHPSAEEVYLRTAKVDDNISLATVYRTINLLEGWGIIEKLNFQDGKARYELKAGDSDHHHHLIDLNTGKIVEFQDKELEALKHRIAKQLGYKLVNHRLELYGIKEDADN